MLLTFIQSMAEVWWVVPILIGLGVVFSVIEAIIPGFGFFGISGIVMFISGIIYYSLIADTAWKVLVLLLAVCLLIVILFIFVSKSASFGMLGKTPFFENKTALPVDYDLNDMMNNAKYVNKNGEVVVDLKPLGKIKINDDIIEAYSIDGFLEKGTIVKVVSVDDEKVNVQKN